MNKITRRYVVDQLSDGKWNLLVLPADYDFAQGLPAGGFFFDTKEEVLESLQRQIDTEDPGQA